MYIFCKNSFYFLWKLNYNKIQNVDEILSTKNTCGTLKEDWSIDWVTAVDKDTAKSTAEVVVVLDVIEDEEGIIEISGTTKADGGVGTDINHLWFYVKQMAIIKIHHFCTLIYI